MKRGAEEHSTPLPAKRRVVETSRSQSASQLKAVDRVNDDGHKETKDEILDNANMLPEGARDHPRAYLVPTRPSTAAGKSQVHSKKKRNFDFDNDTVPPLIAPTATSGLPPRPRPPPLYRLPPFPPPPAYARPATDPRQAM